jgi:hypothetical protein
MCVATLVARALDAKPVGLESHADFQSNGWAQQLPLAKPVRTPKIILSLAFCLQATIPTEREAVAKTSEAPAKGSAGNQRHWLARFFTARPEVRKLHDAVKYLDSHALARSDEAARLAFDVEPDGFRESRIVDSTGARLRAAKLAQLKPLPPEALGDRLREGKSDSRFLPRLEVTLLYAQAMRDVDDFDSGLEESFDNWKKLKSSPAALILAHSVVPRGRGEKAMVNRIRDHLGVGPDDRE